jgi:hypothetical protein
MHPGEGGVRDLRAVIAASMERAFEPLEALLRSLAPHLDFVNLNVEELMTQMAAGTADDLDAWKERVVRVGCLRVGSRGREPGGGGGRSTLVRAGCVCGRARSTRGAARMRCVCMRTARGAP